jgi:hypothetical protein
LVYFSDDKLVIDGASKANMEPIKVVVNFKNGNQFVATPLLNFGDFIVDGWIELADNTTFRCHTGLSTTLESIPSFGGYDANYFFPVTGLVNSKLSSLTRPINKRQARGLFTPYGNDISCVGYNGSGTQLSTGGYADLITSGQLFSVCISTTAGSAPGVIVPSDTTVQECNDLRDQIFGN